MQHEILHYFPLQCHLFWKYTLIFTKFYSTPSCLDDNSYLSYNTAGRIFGKFNVHNSNILHQIGVMNLFSFFVMRYYKFFLIRYQVMSNTWGSLTTIHILNSECHLFLSMIISLFVKNIWSSYIVQIRF